MHCVENTCDNSTGICGECLKGFYGEKCQKSCPNTCPSCQQATGQCLSCRDGWFGPHCFFKCVLCFSCEIQSGICTTCKPTKWGPHCQDDCSRNCYICRIHNGQCVQCSRGFYGENCEKRCPNCFRGLCRPTTGTCHFGCQEGYYGTYCENPCPSNCKVCDQNDGSCKVEKPSRKGSITIDEKENSTKKGSNFGMGKKPRKLTIISNPKSKMTLDTSNDASQTDSMKSFSKKMASDVHVLVEGGLDTSVKDSQSAPNETEKTKNNIKIFDPSTTPTSVAPSTTPIAKIEDSLRTLQEGGPGTSTERPDSVPAKEQKLGNLTIISNPLSKMTSNMSSTVSQTENSRKLASDLHILTEGHLDTSIKRPEGKSGVKNSNSVSLTNTAGKTSSSFNETGTESGI